MTQKLKTQQKEEYRETELGLLPREWNVENLGNYCKVSSGGSAPQGKKYFEGDHPFIRVQHICNKNFTINKYDLITDKAVKDYRLKLFEKNTIVFPKSGASVYLEKRAKLPCDAYVVSHLCAINSINEKLNQNFLYFYLRFKKLAEKKASGYPTLNISEVKQIKIPLPPLPEQKKIAYVLSTVQEDKEKTENMIKSLKEFKKSMMKHLFTYGPVSFEDTEKVKLKETEIGRIPEDWAVKEIQEICNLVMGQSPPGNTYNKKEGTPFLQGKAEFGYMHPIHIKFTTKPLKIGKKNSILMSVRAPVGDVNIADKDYCIGRGLCSISMKNNNNKFLYYSLILRKSDIQGEGTGSTFKAINKSKVQQFKLTFPPEPTQQQISQILSTIDLKIEKEENKKKALEELFKSMLHNLMTAKIRVKDLDFSNNYLCRVFYLDTMFNKYTYSKKIKPQEIEKELLRIKNESENLTIEEIENRVIKINSANRFWYNRYKNKDVIKCNVKVDNLIIEKEHDCIDGIPNSAGKRLITFLNENKNNKEVKNRLNFILKYFEINKYLPIIVKAVDNKNFEVMMGNHRAMAYIKKGCKEIPVLIVEESKDA